MKETLNVTNFETFFDSSKTNEYIKFWNDFGFLEGLNDEMKKIMAEGFQKLAVYIINNEDKKYSIEKIETISFPIFRRVQQEINKPIEIDTFMNVLNENNQNAIDVVDNLLKKHNKTRKDCDFEAEWCAAISDIIIEIMK